MVLENILLFVNLTIPQTCQSVCWLLNDNLCLQIAAICQEAGMHAVRKNRYVILPKDFEKGYRTNVKKPDTDFDFYKWFKSCRRTKCLTPTSKCPLLLQANLVNPENLLNSLFVGNYVYLWFWSLSPLECSFISCMDEIMSDFIFHVLVIVILSNWWFSYHFNV